MKIYTLTVNRKGEWPHGGTTPLAVAFRSKKKAQEWIVNTYLQNLYWDWSYKFINDWRCWVSKNGYGTTDQNMSDYENHDAFYIDIIDCNIMG